MSPPLVRLPPLVVVQPASCPVRGLSHERLLGSALAEAYKAPEYFFSSSLFLPREGKTYGGGTKAKAEKVVVSGCLLLVD